MNCVQLHSSKAIKYESKIRQVDSRTVLNKTLAALVTLSYIKFNQNNNMLFLVDFSRIHKLLHCTFFVVHTRLLQKISHMQCKYEA